MADETDTPSTPKDGESSPPSLAVLLAPQDAARLREAGADPADFTVLQFQAVGAEASQPLPDGSVVIKLHLVIPPGLIKPLSVFRAANGGGNVYDGAIGAMPEARVLVRIDRLEPQAKEKLQQHVAELIGQPTASAEEPAD